MRSPSACYLRNSVTFFGSLKKCRLQNCSPSAFRTDSSPLQVRISIRDSFDPPTAPVQVSLTRLNSVVGYDFSLVIPWADIHRDLASSFPDISILVPSVGNALTAYLNRIVTLLDDEKFQEAFLEKMSNPGYRNIVVLVGEQSNEDKSFFDKNGKLTLSLPRTGPQWFRQMSSRVGHDIEALFLTGGATSSSTPAIVTSMQKVSIADWVDVPSSTSQRVPAVTSLPSLNTLSKPESLFRSLLPYFIVVTNSGASIHIQGSHQPTIDLVHGYFQMHTRKNMNLTTQEPYLRVDLNQSYWGTQMYEVNIHLNDQRTVSWAPTSGVTLILSFLVSVCGYELEKSEQGWYFLKRDTPFE